MLINSVNKNTKIAHSFVFRYLCIINLTMLYSYTIERIDYLFDKSSAFSYGYYVRNIQNHFKSFFTKEN